MPFIQTSVSSLKLTVLWDGVTFENRSEYKQMFVWPLDFTVVFFCSRAGASVSAGVPSFFLLKGYFECIGKGCVWFILKH